MRKVSVLLWFVLRYMRYSGNKAFLRPLFLRIQHWITPSPFGHGFTRNERKALGSSRFTFSMDVICWTEETFLGVGPKIASFEVALSSLLSSLDVSED